MQFQLQQEFCYGRDASNVRDASINMACQLQERSSSSRDGSNSRDSSVNKITKNSFRRINSISRRDKGNAKDASNSRNVSKAEATVAEGASYCIVGTPTAERMSQL
jgi:hypothetical protein